MKPLHPILGLDIPVPSLIRNNNGIAVNPEALDQTPPPLCKALGEILDTPNAGKLLLGLNELFGSASEYAIAGSTALALHHFAITSQKNRQPNDLDVVVSPSAMDRLGDLDHRGLAQLNFSSEPGNTESLNWLGWGEKPLVVDVIPARDSLAGRGFDQRQTIQGVKVIPLKVLQENLRYRIQHEPGNDQSKGDLAVINWVLNEQASTD